ncbi:uncharacterized protein K460DRAFT_356738 [Cucurbitaria berberidis CBS 394.84]|uniref:Uncharacterized protein n=1 Tax=Cucurbitaria berberidis CBS 394.84 TaxID=1168544 RepID=A0A9P4L632_9PLEO|nr:uncharacterized protein K460DRAFT_356738 [Cucurbitaria berberidis CBS 394.84]KAF1842947.1 hypothetical protein K460DRAFT_356738 [Cucurbitaria berberidis CBS 394.84]
MSMSKAMAAECSGEVFLMTMTNLEDKKPVPEDGIWWQVEFPTLIDENRPANKKVTKITYIQVPDLTAAQFKILQDLPDDEKTPPEEIGRGEYWPMRPGKEQLDESKALAGKQGDSQQKRSPTTSDNHEDSQQKRSPSSIGFVKRADRSDTPVCAYGEECYPYPYPIKDMYEWYKDVAW